MTRHMHSAAGILLTPLCTLSVDAPDVRRGSGLDQRGLGPCVPHPRGQNRAGPLLAEIALLVSIVSEKGRSFGRIVVSYFAISGALGISIGIVSFFAVLAGFK